MRGRDSCLFGALRRGVGGEVSSLFAGGMCTRCACSFPGIRSPGVICSGIPLSDHNGPFSYDFAPGCPNVYMISIDFL